MNNIDSFLNFLIDAKTHTYATKGEYNEIKLQDGTKELNFQKNNFKYRDRYFGFNPFSGEEIVWFWDRPLWSMNYYGVVTNKKFSKEIYDFLKQALRKVEQKYPFRGPKKFVMSNFEYNNKSIGSVKYFNGKETIRFKGKLVYTLYYHGGLISEKNA